MLHDPDILILDEPTSGLDPNQIVEIRDLIKEIGQEKTVILSTHILPEVQATCSRILIINNGQLVADGTPEDLRAREKTSCFAVTVEACDTPAEAFSDKIKSLKGVAACAQVDSEPGALGFAIDAKGDADLRKDLFQMAVQSQWSLLELTRESASLEDVFRHLTTGEPTNN